MKFGISIFLTHKGPNPGEMASAAENLGFDSIFVSEHSHIPVDTEFPLGGDVPMPYRSMHDPFVALGAAASVTSRIKLGTAIIILPQHNAINCAKAIATLDHISNGRVIFGIGAGWNPPEMVNHGVAFEDRFKATRERIEAMKALWTQEVAEYEGDTVQFTPSWQWPKPVQDPHPPLLIAGAGPNILKRVVALGDGWLPVFAMEWHDSLKNKQTPLHTLADDVAELKRLADAAGKSAPTISALGLPATAEYIDQLAENGVERMILTLPPDDPAAAFDTLNTYADKVAAYRAG